MNNLKEYNLGQFSHLLSAHTEVRLQRNKEIIISLVKGDVMSNTSAMSHGINARVQDNGLFGFAAKSNPTEEEVKKVIEMATQNAHFLAQREATRKLEVSAPATGVFDYSSEKAKLSQKEYLQFAKEVDRYIEEKYPKLLTRSVSIQLLDMEKKLLTSSGSNVYSLTPRALFVVSLTAETKDGPVSYYEYVGGRGSFEDHLSTPEDLFPRIDKIYDTLMKKCEAVAPNPGLKEVVLDADLAGILAHEAIGHTVEADMVLGGSVAADYMDKQVASELVTLTDFAHTYNGETCPVPIHIDDEGTKAEDAVIIKDGILKQYMHNIDSANHFNTAPTGNARAYDYDDEPLIRMRNTAIMPGTSKLEEMISSIEDGYYLVKSKNGQADSTSEFMFGINLGYEIKNGQISRAIKETTIAGIAFDVLKSVSMVSDDMSWTAAGMCGKKQSIPVGMGGPALKCKINIGG